METGCFSLLHEFLGHLYCLITWQGGFNSRPGPVYFGMGRISLWGPGLIYFGMGRISLWGKLLG